jgi:hypothetical protein
VHNQGEKPTNKYLISVTSESTERLKGIIEKLLHELKICCIWLSQGRTEGKQREGRNNNSDIGDSMILREENSL